jgi:hypothetical protein
VFKQLLIVTVASGEGYGPNIPLDGLPTISPVLIQFEILNVPEKLRVTIPPFPPPFKEPLLLHPVIVTFPAPLAQYLPTTPPAFVALTVPLLLQFTTFAIPEVLAK